MMFIPSAAQLVSLPFIGVWVGSEVAQLAPNNVETALAWEAVPGYHFDTDNMFDPGDPQAITIRTAGYYQVGYSMLIGLDSTQTDFQTYSLLNGGTTLMGAGPNSFDNLQNWWGGVSAIQHFVAGDDFRVAVFQTNVAANDLSAGGFAPGGSAFWAYKIG